MHCRSLRDTIIVQCGPSSTAAVQNLQCEEYKYTHGHTTSAWAVDTTNQGQGGRQAVSQSFMVPIKLKSPRQEPGTCDK